MKTVENCYSEYNNFQNNIYTLPLSGEAQDEEEEEYVKFEMLFNDLSIRLNSLIETVTKAQALLSVAPASGAIAAPEIAVPNHLPPLKVPLPSFDGTYENWFSFKCMFRRQDIDYHLLA